MSHFALDPDPRKCGEVSHDHEKDGGCMSATFRLKSRTLRFVLSIGPTANRRISSSGPEVLQSFRIKIPRQILMNLQIKLIGVNSDIKVG